jgi:lipoprotein-releasing system ATP-binding protein
MKLHPALSLHKVSRHYGGGESELTVFDNLSLDVRAGEVVALLGQSGSGKSSLLHIAGLLERPTTGQVLVAGQDCTAMDDASRTRVRRIGIGFVYQFHHLLPEFSALENVIMPQLIAGASKPAAATRAKELLRRLRLDHRLDIANRPLLLLADEPTGNLDPGTAALVQEEFMRLIHEEGLGALIATHNVELAKRMTRTFVLSNGKLVKR